MARRKRDLVAEILGKRERTLRRADRYQQFNRRHDAIIDAVELLRRHGRYEPHGRTELLKYVPIGIVACWEGYFRMVIRDLIDFGAPYRENASKLDEPRLDLGAVLAMGQGRVTIGEFIAHQLPISSLEDVNRHLTALLGVDFLERLKEVEDRPNESTITDIAGRLFDDVQAIFRYRHVYCHELAVKVQPTVGSAGTFVGASLVFTYAVEKLIQEHIGCDMADAPAT